MNKHQVFLYLLQMKKEELRIVFMGTPEFAVPTLHKIVNSGFRVVAVITAPDKPAGRGKKMLISAVKKAALEMNLPLLQPENLKDGDFIQKLKAINANLQIVVAFRMLPVSVWSMPELGTFNLHASLLPQYRGAAPINHAIINGEKETGLTTFFLDKEIDTGSIIKQIRIPVANDETATQLHDRMMIAGANLVEETIDLILNGDFQTRKQENLNLEGTELKKAPKILKEDCRINWGKEGLQIINFIRGLSDYPATFTELVSDKGDEAYLKVYKASFEEMKHSFQIGQLLTDNKNFLKIAVPNGFVQLLELQQAGKNRNDITSFLRGRGFEGIWKAKL